MDDNHGVQEYTYIHIAITTKQISVQDIISPVTKKTKRKQNDEDKTNYITRQPLDSLRSATWEDVFFTFALLSCVTREVEELRALSVLN